MGQVLALTIVSVLLVACGEDDSDDDDGGGGTTIAGCNVDIGSRDFSYRGTEQLYLSPTGNDSNNDCKDSSNPCKTFNYAVMNMEPGEGLILLDGTYTLADNGSLEKYDKADGSPTSPHSALLPSGLSASRPTVVAAQNPGNVFIEGGLRIGYAASHLRREYILVHGLTFHSGSGITNGQYVAIKDSGFEGGLGMGDISHSDGVRCNLIEDSWVWGREFRSGLRVYRSNNNLLRRVLVRMDGCDEEWCGEKAGNGVNGVTVYNSNNNRLENILVMDRFYDHIGSDGPVGDYTTAQHDSAQTPPPGGELNHNNEWLGCMTVNSVDRALKFDNDHVGPRPTGTIREFVALATNGGVAIDSSYRPYTGFTGWVFDDIRVWPHFGQFIVGCNSGSSPDCNGAHTVSNIDQGTYAPAAGLAALKLPQKRYGTNTDLWPWPNEARIKSEICNVDGAPIARGVCGTALSISDYLFTF